MVTGEETAHAPSAGVAVVDPTGAGDAVAAVVVHAHLSGLSAEETVRLAAAAAAVVVQAPEATPAALADVLRR
jgi:sugar/nucleoside kinase (ribokinase family)